MLAALVVVGLVTLIWRVTLDSPGAVNSALAMSEALETGIQDIVFVGIGLAFLVSAENRIKRRRALEYMRELRAVLDAPQIREAEEAPVRAPGGACVNVVALSR